ncbi:FERM domain-containing protein 8 isoform X2 [Chiloscyllium plagiosum]|uniref:FERM domain-containing protein 8 isoform X2 n=1 Tax=Chiloscyllium plagiosum TaxID=36176 RepID=UPI001CB7B202|nr:FERM domain-containing protein 8 isoform X2 [Chiloscyllium plagiosum]
MKLFMMNHHCSFERMCSFPKARSYKSRMKASSDCYMKRPSLIFWRAGTLTTWRIVSSWVPSLVELSLVPSIRTSTTWLSSVVYAWKSCTDQSMVSQETSLEQQTALSCCSTDWKEQTPHKAGLKRRNGLLEKIDTCLPTHLCKKHGGFLAAFRSRGAKQHGYEEELLESFRQLVDDAAREEPEALKLHYRSYLEKCHLLRYYGSAMFTGEIDKPVQSFLHRNGRKLVTIAISLDGVSVMDSKEKCVLLTLCFHELSWEYTSSEDEESDDILWLEFDGEEGGAVVNKLLKIYSKQAELMSGMIDYCIDFNNTFEVSPVQDAVAAKPPRPKEKRGKLKRQNSVVCNRIQQLSTIDYVEEGQEIKRVKPKRAASFFTRQISQGPVSYTAVEVTETLEQG